MRRSKRNPQLERLTRHLVRAFGHPCQALWLDDNTWMRIDSSPKGLPRDVRQMVQSAMLADRLRLVALRLGSGVKKDRNGRPGLTHPKGWDANGAHGGDLVGLVLSRTGAIGIDLEPDRWPRATTHRDVLHPSETVDSAACFAEIWAAKESYCKARGLGLGIDPSTLVTSVRRPARLRPTTPGLDIQWTGRCKSIAWAVARLKPHRPGRNSAVASWQVFQ